MWHFAVAHNFLIFSFTLIYFFKRVNQNCGPCGFSKEMVAFRSSFGPLSASVHITANMNVKRFQSVLEDINKDSFQSSVHQPQDGVKRSQWFS